MASKLHAVLRALHVHARYTALTGKELPVEVDYFHDCLLGGVAPVGTAFAEGLAQSVRQVGYYLYVRA